MDKTKLTNKIKFYRAMRGITQMQLAEGVGVTRKTINTIETGRFVPSATLALKIARYFETPMEEIFILEEEA
jgi:putative transcriptional regulator